MTMKDDPTLDAPTALWQALLSGTSIKGMFSSLAKHRDRFEIVLDALIARTGVGSSEELERLAQELVRLQDSMEQYIKDQDFERAALARDRRRRLLEKHGVRHLSSGSERTGRSHPDYLQLLSERLDSTRWNVGVDSLAADRRPIEPGDADGAEYAPNLDAALQEGMRLRDTGDLHESRAVFETLLEDHLRTFGEKHSAVLHAKSHLARTLHALGESARAAQLFEANVQVRRETYGPFHPYTLNSTALWAEALGAIDGDVGAEPPWKLLLEGLVDLVLTNPTDLRLLQNDFLRIVRDHVDLVEDETVRQFTAALLELAQAERDGGNVLRIASEVEDSAQRLGYFCLQKQLAREEAVFVPGKLGGSVEDVMSLSGPPDRRRPRADVSSLSDGDDPPPSIRSPALHHFQPLRTLSPVEEVIAAQQQRRSSSTSRSGVSVDCTVFGPPRLARGQTILIQVLAHEPFAADEAARIAQEADFEATKRTFCGLSLKLQRSDEIWVHLEIHDLEVDDPIQMLSWLGRTESVQFPVHAPSDAREGSHICKVTISMKGVPVGHVRFRIDVTDTPSHEAPMALGDSSRQYCRAFVSYASEDRAEVLKRVQMLALLDINYFQDVFHLSPGVRWMRKLYAYIDECDLFLLFWSPAARESRYVKEELRRALHRKGDDENAPPEILPIIVGPPPPAEPPEELKELHFNDYMVYMIHGFESGQT